MRSGLTVRLVAAALAAAAVATPAAAQYGGPPPGGPPGGAGGWDERRTERRAERRDEIRRRIETIRLWRLTETLRLDAEQAARFVPLDRRVWEAEQALLQGARSAGDDLERLLDEGADAATLDRAIDSTLDAQKRLYDEYRAAVQEVRRVLTPEQTARYLVFQRTFAQEIRRLIAEARGGGRPGVPQGGRGGPGGEMGGPGGGYGQPGGGPPGGGPPPPPPDEGDW